MSDIAQPEIPGNITKQRISRVFRMARFSVALIESWSPQVQEKQPGRQEKSPVFDASGRGFSK
jgi:hypothetical protein